MTALILALLTSAIGFVVVLNFGQKTFVTLPEKIASSLALGITLPAALGALLNIVIPTNLAVFTAGIVWAIFGILSAILYWKAKTKNEPLIKEGLPLPVWGFIIVLTVLICSLSYAQLMPLGNSAVIPSRGSNDTIFHLAQIQYIGQAHNWHFDSPYFAGEFINYPFLSEFFSAGLVKFGASLISAYHWPDFILFFCLLLWLCLLPKTFSKKFSVVWIFALGVLFAGGLSYLNSVYYSSAPSAVTFPFQPISYQGLILSFLLFQKSFILGVVLGLTCLYCVVKYLNTKNKNNLQWATVFGCLLPFAHTHTFIALSLGLFGIFLGLLISGQEKSREFFKFLLVFTCLTLPQVLAIILLPKFSLDTTPFFRMGWMSNPLEAGAIKLSSLDGGHFMPWMLLQMWNFGFLLLWPILGYFSWKKRQKNYIAFCLFWGGALIWIFANIVQLQAWDYDTNKLFVYAVAFLILSTISLISLLKEQIQKQAILILAIIIVLALPMSVVRIYQTFHFGVLDKTTIFTSDQQTAAVWLKNNTAADAVVLTGILKTTKDSAYLAGLLSGRTNTEAYPLWLYTHDIDYLPRQKIIAQFLVKPNDAELLKKLPADYLVVGPEVLKDLPDLIKNLDAAGFKKTYENETLKIYKLN